jgi:acyl-CoA thioesterase-2
MIEEDWNRFMSTAIEALLATLDLEPLEVNLFRGRSPQVGWQRVFGGQVIGQALVAACRTVVDVANRHGHAIFTMAASYHRAEPGLDHQAKMPDVPKPEDLPSEDEMKQRILPLMPEAARRYYECERPIELRPVEYGRYTGAKFEDGRFHVWIKATGTLPDEPAIHQCVLAYASDMTLLDAALIPHGRTVFEKEIMAASLDHALWFHRPFRADEWLLYAQDSPSLHGARGFARGLIFARDGTLVASVAQEGLLRERRKDG